MHFLIWLGTHAPWWWGKLRVFGTLFALALVGGCLSDGQLVTSPSDIEPTARGGTRSFAGQQIAGSSSAVTVAFWYEDSQAGQQSVNVYAALLDICYDEDELVGVSCYSSWSADFGPQCGEVEGEACIQGNASEWRWGFADFDGIEWMDGVTMFTVTWDPVSDHGSTTVTASDFEDQFGPPNQQFPFAFDFEDVEVELSW